MIEGELHGRGLVVRVENFEVARQAEARGFAAQEPRRECVKGSNPRNVKRVSLAHQQIADALFHLLRGFVGECNGEDRAAGHALEDQVRDAIRHRPRFARARARQDQHGTPKGRRGFQLSGIQFVEKSHFEVRARQGNAILTDGDGIGKFARFPERNGDYFVGAPARSISKKKSAWLVVMNVKSGT
jgi:hypothetical protein